MKHVLIVFGSVMLPFLIYSQPSKNILFGNTVWLKSDSIGLHELTGSNMYGYEGTCSISDEEGNLILYSNGVTVYNKFHEILLNGDSLAGHISSMQSVIIVPDPAKINEYYLFTTDAYPNQFQNGLRWSKIKMDTLNGHGAIISKNNLLLTEVHERLCCVKRNNCDGYWIISYKYPSTYYSYPIDEFGIGVPITSVGQVIETNSSSVGAIIIDGKGYLINIFQHWTGCSLEFGKFNLDNGVIEIKQVINLPTDFFVFSPIIIGSVYVYVPSSAAPYPIYRYKIFNELDSCYLLLDTIIEGVIGYKTFFWGVDSILYIMRLNKKKLSAIINPLSETQFSVVDSIIPLTNKCRLGPINEIVIPSPQYYPPIASFSAEVLKICPDSCIGFKNNSCDAYQFEWFFEGALPSYSTEKNPQNICYPNSGTFDVMLVAHHGTYSDTAYMPDLIQVYEPPQFSIGQNGNMLFCNNPQPGYSYQWYLNGTEISGATTSSYVATQSGTYHLQVTVAQGCKATQSIEVIVSGYAYPMNLCDVSIKNRTEQIIQMENTGSSRIQYHLTDVNGRILHKGELNASASNSITLEGRGVYFLQVQCEQGVKVYRVIGM